MKAVVTIEAIIPTEVLAVDLTPEVASKVAAPEAIVVSGVATEVAEYD